MIRAVSLFCALVCLFWGVNAAWANIAPDLGAQDFVEVETLEEPKPEDYLRFSGEHLSRGEAAAALTLVACLKRPELRQGRWQVLEVRPAWDGNLTWDRFLAFAWEAEAHQRLLIAVNLGPTQGQGYVRFPFTECSGKKVTLQDLMSEARHEREGNDLLNRGLYLDLPVWGFHVFAG